MSVIAIQDRCAARRGNQDSYVGVYLLVTLRVMIFDMLKLRRVFEGGNVPVQLPQPLMQRRITRSDVTNVALEMLHIDGVEANDGSVETNVRFGDVGTEVVRSGILGKVGFGTVEGGEKGPDGFFICFLRSRDGMLVVERLATREWGRMKGRRAYVAKPDL